MDSLFLFRENTFHAYTLQHYIPLALVFLLGLFSVKYAQNKSEDQQWAIVWWISMISFLGCLMTPLFALIEGDFNIQDDLPFHLCRFIGFTTPFVLKYRSRYWIGVFYFWILAGTLNSNITPDVEFAFPHWTYFSYWMNHSFLVIVPIYLVLVFKIKITIKDMWNAFWAANAFMVMTLVINYTIGSNYMYTIKKPPVESLLDMLGPWPFYLINGQLLALLLFFIVWLPFWRPRKVSS